VGLCSYEGGVISVMDMAWKRSWRVSWNPEGMCFRFMPGTPYWPAALWSRVRLRASCMVAGVMQPEIIGNVCLWLGETRRCHGNLAPCGIVGLSDMAWVSSFCTCAITSAGSTKRLPVASSLRMKRIVGRGWELSSSAAVRRMDCKATFGFLINIRRRAFPY